MKPQIRQVSTGYQPRPLQSQIHNNLKRFSVVVCHRGFGKTVMCVNQLIDSALRCDWPMGRFQYIAPLLKQAKDIAWGYLKQYSLPIPGTKFNESELYAEYPNGARVTIYGADNPDAFRGLYFDGVVLDEFAQMDPAMWTQIILPRIDDHNGWVCFIGTPKGQNSFWEQYEKGRIDPEWYTALFKASQTGIFTPEQLVRFKANMADDDEFEQEFECSFAAAAVGSYYGKLVSQADDEGRIAFIPYDARFQVRTAWDLGIGDATAIWFVQEVKQAIHVIDYYENSGYGLDHYVKVLRDRPYSYAEHIMPHDVGVKELGTGVSRIETLRSLGVYPRVLARFGLEDGIQAGRTLIPKCRFDKAKTAQGVKALRQYQKKWDGRMMCFRNEPQHDWTSHCADAWRYLALGLGLELTATMKPIKYDKHLPSGAFV